MAARHAIPLCALMLMSVYGFTRLPPSLTVEELSTARELPYDFHVISSESDPADPSYVESVFVLKSHVAGFRAGRMEVGYLEDGEVVLSTTLVPVPLCSETLSMYELGLARGASENVLLQVLYYNGETPYSSPDHRWVRIAPELLFSQRTELSCE